jgi:hypothetical protein
MSTNHLTSCTVLNHDGVPCGKAGEARLPLGVCAECAIRIVRAVGRLVDLQHR